MDCRKCGTSAGKGEHRVEHGRQFVVNALVMQLAISQAAGLARCSPICGISRPSTYPNVPKLPLTTGRSSGHRTISSWLLGDFGVRRAD
jgi:hypothetical protein